MAKNKPDEVKGLIEGLYKIIQTTNAQSQEQVKINKELLKVIALLNEGFAKNESDARELIDKVREGLEIQDDFAVKWAKARKAEKKDVDELLKKFREIEQIQEDEIDNAEDYLELLSDRFDFVEDEYDITKKLLSSQKEILKIIGNNKKIYEKIGGNVLDIDNKLTNIVKKKVDLDNLFGGALQGMQNAEIAVDGIRNDITEMLNNIGRNIVEIPLQFNPITGDLDKEIIRIEEIIDKEKFARIEGLESYYKRNETLQKNMARQFAAQQMSGKFSVDIDNGEIKKANKILLVGTDEYKKAIKQIDVQVKKLGIDSKVKQDLGQIVQLLSLGADRTDEQSKSLEALSSSVGLANKLLLEQVQIQLDDLSVSKSMLITEAQKSKIIAKNIDLFRSTEKAVMRVGQKFDYIASLLPEGVSDLLGFSQVSENLLANHKKGLEQMSNVLTTGGTRASALKGYYTEMTPAIKNILNPLTLVVAGTLLLWKYMQGVTETLKNVSSEMNVSLGQADLMFKKQLDTLTAYNNQFASLKDIQMVHQEMIGSSGKFYSAMQKGNESLSISLIEMGKVFGYGATEATKIHKIYTDLGANNDLAENLQTNVGFMAEMAGLSPQIIGKDLVDASEEVFTYFAGMPEQAAKAVVNIRRMGMSLKQAGQIAQKMLDLEGFMTDMYELNAMTSRGIDFSKAFDLGLMGDVEGMTKEIMQNIGSTQQFNQMDYLTRTKIAKTLGMSMEDLAKSVKMHEQMAMFSGEEKTMLEANADRLGDISKLNKDQIRQRLQELQSTDRLNIAWEKIKGVLIKSLLPLVEAFADAIDAIMPLLDIIIGAFKVVGVLIKPLASFVKGMLAPLKLIGNFIDMIGKKLFGTDDVVKSLTDSFDKMSGVIEVIGTIFGTWYLSKKVLGGFGVLKSEGSGLLSMIPSFGTSMSKSFSEGSDSAKKSIKEVEVSVQKANLQMDTTVEKVKKTDKELKKVKQTSTGLFSKLGASEGFSTAKDIATKTISAIAVGEGLKLLGMGKNIGEGINQNSGAIESAMGGVFAIGGTMLSDYLNHAITKVFEKKLEKKFESGFGKAGKKGASEIEGTIGKTFDPIAAKGKVMFEKLTGFAKKILPSAFSTLEQNIPSIQKTAIDSVKETATETVKDKAIETVSKKKTTIESKKILETVSDKTKDIKPKEIPAPELKGADKPVRSAKKVTNTITGFFDNMFKIVDRAWKSLKGILSDIVTFVSQSLSKLGKGVGEMIKGILGGIADGLNKFKKDAIIGASALLIVSGALWVASKAFENFANVTWDGVAKGLVGIGGLVAMAKIMAKGASDMIVGAVAIGILGAALIPAAYAFQMFNEVEWASLGKAAVAIIELGLAGAILGPLIPVMAAGAIAIALLGAALIPAAIAFQMFNDVEWESLGKAAVAIIGLATVASLLSTIIPFLVVGAAGIAILGAALIPLALGLIMLNKVEFDSIKKGILALVGLGSVAAILGMVSPLILAAAGSMAFLSVTLIAITASVVLLNSTLKNLQIDKIKEFGSEIAKLATVNVAKLFGVAAGVSAIGSSFLIFSAGNMLAGVSKFFGAGGIVGEITRLAILSEPIKTLTDSILIMTDALTNLALVSNSLDFNKLNKLPQIVPNIQKPSPEATAQNVNVHQIVQKKQQLEIERDDAVKNELEYSADSLSSISMKRVEQLLQQLINIQSQQSNQPLQVSLSQSDLVNLNSRLKAINNK